MADRHARLIATHGRLPRLVRNEGCRFLVTTPGSGIPAATYRDVVAWLAAPLSIVMVGIWLALSVLLWPHGAGQSVLAIAAGVLFVSFASLQLRCWPWALAMNVTVAVWLAVGALLLPEASPLTIFNHVLCSAAVLSFSWLALHLGAVGRDPVKDDPDVL